MTPMNCSSDAMEKGLENNIFVDYRKRGSIFECTTVQAIRDICDKVVSIVFYLYQINIKNLLSLESPLHSGRLSLGCRSLAANADLPDCVVASFQVSQTD